MATFMLHVRVWADVPDTTAATDAAERILGGLPNSVTRLLRQGSMEVWVEEEITGV